MRSIEQIGGKGEKAVGEHVPEQDALRDGVQETRPIYHLRVTVPDGLEQRGIIERVIFQVGILDEDDIAAGMLQAGAHGGTLAAVDWMRIDDGRWIVEGIQDCLGLVGRAVIDEEHLLNQVGFFHFLIGAEDGGFFVEDGDNDADFHIKDYK